MYVLKKKIINDVNCRIRPTVTMTSHIISSSAASPSKSILLVCFLHIRVLGFLLLVVLLSFATVVGMNHQGMVKGDTYIQCQRERVRVRVTSVRGRLGPVPLS